MGRNKDPHTNKSVQPVYTQGTMVGKCWLYDAGQVHRKERGRWLGKPPGRVLEDLEGLRLRTARRYEGIPGRGTSLS